MTLWTAPDQQQQGDSQYETSCGPTALDHPIRRFQQLSWELATANHHGQLQASSVQFCESQLCCTLGMPFADCLVAAGHRLRSEISKHPAMDPFASNPAARVARVVWVAVLLKMPAVSCRSPIVVKSIFLNRLFPAVVHNRGYWNLNLPATITHPANRDKGLWFLCLGALQESLAWLRCRQPGAPAAIGRSRGSRQSLQLVSGRFPAFADSDDNET